MMDIAKTNVERRIKLGDSMTPLFSYRLDPRRHWQLRVSIITI